MAKRQASPAWIAKRTLSVLVLDGSDRLLSFPKLMVFRQGPRWGALIMVAAGDRRLLPERFANEEQARAACLQEARHLLMRRWHRAIDACGAPLRQPAAVSEQSPIAG